MTETLHMPAALSLLSLSSSYDSSSITSFPTLGSSPSSSRSSSPTLCTRTITTTQGTKRLREQVETQPQSLQQHGQPSPPPPAARARSSPPHEDLAARLAREYGLPIERQTAVAQMMARTYGIPQDSYYTRDLFLWANWVVCPAHPEYITIRCDAGTFFSIPYTPSFLPAQKILDIIFIKK